MQTIEKAVISVLRTFEPARRLYWPTEQSAKFVDKANNLIEDYESGNEVDWSLAICLIVNFHTEMGEWLGSH